MADLCWCNEAAKTHSTANDVASTKPHPITLHHGLSWRPGYIVNSTIKINDSIPSQDTIKHSKASSVAAFDILPTEILHSIFNHLDILSLSRLSTTCQHAKTDVQSFPPYKILTTHASTTLIIMARTNLISQHPINSILGTLKTEACVSCGKFGPFMFMITCERACFDCLRTSKDLRAINILTTNYCFGLPFPEPGRLLSMLSIPKTSATNTHKREELVSLRMARNLAIDYFGSEDAMEAAAKRSRRTGLGMGLSMSAAPSILMMNAWLDSSLKKAPSDPYTGMSSALFPVMRVDGSLDHGSWCLGCKELSSDCGYSKYGDLDPQIVDPRECWGDRRYSLEMERRAWSLEEFDGHVGSCEGTLRCE